MVGDMLCEYHECNRHVEEHQAAEVRKGGNVSGFNLIEGFHECELGQVEEAGDGDAFEIVYKRAVIYNFKSLDVRSVADGGEYRGGKVACEDTYKERNELPEALALGGYDNGYEKGYKAAGNGCKAVSFAGGGGLGEVANCVRRKRKTDKSNRGSDYNGGHELVKPAGAHRLDDEGDYHIDKSRKDRAHDNSEEAECGGGEKGGEEGEGASEEDGAFALGEEKIYYGSDTCAEKCGGGVHIEVL